MAESESALLGLDAILGDSPEIRAAVTLARSFARTPRETIILLAGPTGTGKELFARGIHYAGPTAGEPFVAINCHNLQETLFESELFGHEKGAFTGALATRAGLIELAGAGTLFLDEIGDVLPAVQSKLLRVVEERRYRRVGGHAEREVRCRIIAATNVALDDRVREGQFREDLLYRLQGFRIDLPAVRDRGADVEMLAQHYLDLLARAGRSAPRRLSAEAVRSLYRHGWPGNVRELKSVIERAALESPGPVIGPEHLMIQRRTRGPLEESAGRTILIPPEGKSMERIEREVVQATLEMAGGNQSRAARMLRISRMRLSRSLQRHGLVPGPRARRGGDA